jgi:hypothetical protein
MGWVVCFVIGRSFDVVGIVVVASLLGFGIWGIRKTLIGSK